MKKDVARRHERLFGILVFEQLELSDALIRETLSGFVFVSEPLERLVCPCRYAGSVVEEIQFEVNLGAIHVTKANAAGIGQFLMLSADLLQNAQSGRVISPPEVHLRDPAVGNRGPQRHAMPLAVLLRDFEGLDCLVEPVHLGEHVSAIQADRRVPQKVVGVF